MKKYFSLFTFVFLTISLFAQKTIEINNQFLPQKVIVKYNKSLTTRSLSPMLSSAQSRLFSKIGATRIVQKYPNAKQSSNPQSVDLRLIYEIYYSKPYSASSVAKFFSLLPEVEYAQPHYVDKHLTTTNDPYLSKQYYLQTIDAFRAWDIEMGDTSVVIGIIDSGVDLGHEDLIEQVAYNRNDPVNGLDDDNDGFVDNFRGWDLADNDNNPSSGIEDHGTTVAGPAIARANNGKFIAGVAPHCRFLPVKETDSFGSMTAAYQAVVYAADHDCRVINCSWGSTVSLPEALDVMRYASINRKALVIAAAGNDDNAAPFYPASFPMVMSVCATTPKDERWSPLNTDTKSGSTYNYMVDIAAPGASIETIKKPNSIAYVYGGTSVAAPIVSGGAALVASNRPWLSMQQVRAQLEVTAKNIDTIPFNRPYSDMLGRGRLDVYKALKDTLISAIRVDSIAYSDGLDNQFLPNRKITISVRFKNLLHHSGSCTVQLRPISPFINIENGSFTIDTLARGESTTNQGHEFSFSLSDETPLYYPLYFKLLYRYKDRVDQEIFSLQVNKQFINCITPSIQTSVSATGRIGHVTTNNNGVGLLFNGKSVMDVAGLMLATSADSVASSVQFQEDFMPQQAAHSTISTFPFETTFVSRFNDYFDNTNKIGLDVSQQIATMPGLDAIICRYTITNRSSATLNNFIVGQYVDWDIVDAWSNKIDYDSVAKLSYAWCPLSKKAYCGQIVLDNSYLSHYALDGLINDSTIDMTSDFTDEERYKALTMWKNTSGNSSASGTDVMDCMSSGPFTVKRGDSVSVSFALLVANSLDSLRTIASTLRNALQHTSKATEPETPFIQLKVLSTQTNQSILDLSGSYQGLLQIQLYASDGGLVLEQTYIKQQAHEQILLKAPLLNGLYVVRISASNELISAKITVN